MMTALPRIVIRFLQSGWGEDLSESQSVRTWGNYNLTGLNPVLNERRVRSEKGENCGIKVMGLRGPFGGHSVLG